jgi:hypothetical protein
MQMSEELKLVQFGAPRSAIARTTQVRSTLLAASIQALRQRGLVDRYRAMLPGAWAEKLLLTPAGTWLPLEWGEVHYAACDKLELSDDDILGMGNAVGALTQRTVLSVATRLVREAGATPATVITITPRLWARFFVGGAVAALQTGPKDIRFETIAATLLRSRYFRIGYRGLIHSVAAPFCKTLFVREATQRSSDDVVLKLAWV